MILALIAALFAIAAPSASATPTCATDIIGANYVTYQGIPNDDPNFPSVGAVQVRTDGCGNYWAYFKMYHILGGNEYGQAWISRWENGRRSAILSCDNTGGNGHIKATETECRTPVLRSISSASRFVGSAHYYWRVAASEPWIDDSWGQTTGVR